MIDWKLGLVNLALGICIVFSISFLILSILVVGKCSIDIREKGLKYMIEEIWEGQNKEEENEKNTP